MERPDINLYFWLIVVICEQFWYVFSKRNSTPY